MNERTNEQTYKYVKPVHQNENSGMWSRSRRLGLEAASRPIDPQIVTVLFRPADPLRSAFCRVPFNCGSGRKESVTKATDTCRAWAASPQWRAAPRRTCRRTRRDLRSPKRSSPVSAHSAPPRPSPLYTQDTNQDTCNVQIIIIIIIIIIITTTIFIVLSSWPQGHCESSPGECRTAPSGRRPSDQAACLGLWVRLF